MAPTLCLRRQVQVLTANEIKSSDPFSNELLSEMSHYASSADIRMEVIREGTRDTSPSTDVPLIIV